MAREFDVIVVGELNVDLIFNQVQGFPVVGKEILSNDMTLTLGSSSAICASNLSSLGLKVAFIGKLGNDVFGQFIIDKLNRSGVDTSMIIIDDKFKSGATVALSYDEDRAMITHQGAMSYMGLDDIDPKQLKRAKHLHFSSYFFQPGFKNNLHELFEMAKNEGVTTSLDVQWDPSEIWDLNLEQVLPFVDVFIPNEVELKKLTRFSSIDQAIESVKNKCSYVVVKCGSRGSVMYYEDKEVQQKPFLNKDVVDTIGAGDSFNAGFISRFIKGASPEDCQEFGNLIGAISTTEAGGTGAFNNLDEIMKIAKDRFNYYGSIE
jgi:sugar/nucleoside kinase (ribokinase family)